MGCVALNRKLRVPWFAELCIYVCRQYVHTGDYYSASAKLNPQVSTERGQLGSTYT